jgi:hypothetical protein
VLEALDKVLVVLKKNHLVMVMEIVVLRIFLVMVKVVEEYNDVVLVELNSLLWLMVENLMNNQDLIVHQNHLLLNLMVVVVQWKEV